MARPCCARTGAVALTIAAVCGDGMGIPSVCCHSFQKTQVLPEESYLSKTMMWVHGASKPVCVRLFVEKTPHIPLEKRPRFILNTSLKDVHKIHRNPDPSYPMPAWDSPAETEESRPCLITV